MTTQLSYFIPQAHRNKISLCIPETFNLHICPPSCVRRVSIRALRNHTRDHMAFYYLDEADVISGRYCDAIGDAVQEVLDTYDGSIRGFYIYFNCIDDFLGTDEEDVLDQLHERFEGIAFSILRMNPVSNDVHLPTGSVIHSRLYELLRPSSVRDNGVNIVGTFVALDDDCELLDVLGCQTQNVHTDETHNALVRQLFECNSFDDYSVMSQSALNLVLGGIGLYAAQCMETRLNIPYIKAFVSYDIDTVDAFYTELSQRYSLASACAAILSDARNEALASVDRCVGAVGSLPLVIDSSAFMCPFAACRALLKYGFNIRAIFAMHAKEFDEQDRLWIIENHPEIDIIDSQSYQDIIALNIGSDVMCIGYDCAYMLRSSVYVDQYKDEGLFGYQAIRRLMNAMAASLDQRVEWED